MQQTRLIERRLRLKVNIEKGAVSRLMVFFGGRPYLEFMPFRFILDSIVYRFLGFFAFAPSNLLQTENGGGSLAPLAQCITFKRKIHALFHRR